MFDELEIYDRILTPAEIRNNYEKVIPPSAEKKRNELPAPAGKEITLDGILDKNEWQDAACIPIVNPVVGAKPGASGVLYIKHTGENLLIGAELSGGTKSTITGNDLVDIWRDDSFEIHVFTSQKKRYQFIVNPNGAMYDATVNITDGDGNVNIYRIQLLFFGTLKFYGLFFEQTENKENAPFIIAQHGGGDTAEIISSFYDNSGCYRHLVRRMTDKGANVFAPQLLLWRDEPYGATYDRLVTDGKLRQLGGSITALEVYLLRGSIDYFLENEGMNKNKVGVAGMSYGGMYVLHLAAVDERIKACYSCSWVNDGFIHSWADWSYKNAQNFISVTETMALVAPRPLVIGMGDKDDLFDSKYTEIECKKVKPYYQIYDKSENFKTVIFDGWHEAEKTDECLSFLFKQLS